MQPEVSMCSDFEELLEVMLVREYQCLRMMTGFELMVLTMHTFHPWEGRHFDEEEYCSMAEIRSREHVALAHSTVHLDDNTDLED